MSIDYSSMLTIGFLFDHEELEKPFTHHLEEVWHHETRFNELTGAAHTIKVTDVKEDDYVLYCGEDLTGDPIQLMERLCQSISTELGFPVSYWVVGSMYDEEMQFVMGPDFEFIDGEIDPFKLANPELRLQVAKLSDKLKQLGYEPGEYRIRSLLLVC